METSGEALSTRKIVVKSIVIMIAMGIVGVFILDGHEHANRSVRSFIRQKNGAHTTGTDQVSTDILNGNRVNAGDFSSVVGITATPNGAPASDIDSVVCTGVLLTQIDVLTAGHCCRGLHGFKVHTGVELDKKTYNVRHIELKGGYQYNQAKYSDGRTIFTPEKDLCMMTLDKLVEFYPEKIYISRTKPRVGETVDIVGFGMIKSNTDSGDRLYHARTTVTSCANALNWARNKKTVFNDIVCAGHPASWKPWRYAQNACSGDSGGPMLSPKLPNGGRKLYGILSDGNKPCESGENSNTNVAEQEFKDFINRNSIYATWMPICNSPL